MKRPPFETFKGKICKGSIALGTACIRCESCDWEVRQIVERMDESHRLLEAASHALKSYAFGNTATDLAKDMAESIDRFIATGEPQTLVGKAKR
jgi:hypothetical protein